MEQPELAVQPPAPSAGLSGCAPVRFRRFLAGVFIAIYAGSMGLFFAFYALGDVPQHPIAYFFTWDMFPGFFTESSRRIAVGKTQSGRYLQLLPGAYQQYRGGVNAALTHLDLEREGAVFRAAANRALELAADSCRQDPIVHVYLLERYWPDKFNYPAAQYEAWFGTAKPKRHSWRLRDEFDVSLAPPDAPSRQP